MISAKSRQINLSIADCSSGAMQILSYEALQISLSVPDCSPRARQSDKRRAIAVTPTLLKPRHTDAEQLGRAFFS
jgi:hypothetical protein